MRERERERERERKEEEGGGRRISIILIHRVIDTDNRDGELRQTRTTGWLTSYHIEITGSMYTTGEHLHRRMSVHI